MVATPHGMARFTTSPSRAVSRSQDPTSSQARSRPELSSTIASWTIVSSRWVEGLSTGSRPVSASTAMPEGDDGEQPDGGHHAGGVIDSRGHDRRQGRGADRDRQRVHGDQHGRFDQGPDGHVPAGPHPAERGPGLQAEQGQGHRAQQEHRDHHEQVVGHQRQRRRCPRAGPGRRAGGWTSSAAAGWPTSAGRSRLPSAVPWPAACARRARAGRSRPRPGPRGGPGSGASPRPAAGSGRPRQ